MAAGGPDQHGGGLHALDPARDLRRPGAVEVRMVHADWQLQGSRRERDAVLVALARRRGGAGGQLRQWRRGGRGLRGGRRIARTIFVPAATSPAKIVQMRAYGAEIRLMPGTRDEVAEAAMGMTEAGFYASHNWQPFFLQGTKTLAYELWGGSRLSSSGQCDCAVRRRIERSGLRDRFLRAVPRRRDRAARPGSSPPSPPIARRSRLASPPSRMNRGRSRKRCRPSPRGLRSRSRCG